MAGTVFRKLCMGESLVPRRTHGAVLTVCLEDRKTECLDLADCDRFLTDELRRPPNVLLREIHSEIQTEMSY